MQEMMKRHETELREMEIRHQEALQLQQAIYFQSLKEQEDMHNNALKEAHGELVILYLDVRHYCHRGVIEGEGIGKPA